MPTLRPKALVALLGALVLVLSACASTSGEGTVDPDASASEQSADVGESPTSDETTEPTDTATETPTEPSTPPSDADGEGADGGEDAPPVDDDSCTTADLDISLSEPEGAMGSAYYEMSFTNTGSADCTLTGFPRVMYVAGDDGHQVGAEAAEDGPAGDEITLAPGDSVVSVLRTVVVYNFDEEDCQPTEVRGLRIYPPGADKAAYIELPGDGCAAEALPGGMEQLTITAVTPPPAT